MVRVGHARAPQQTTSAPITQLASSPNRGEDAARCVARPHRRTFSLLPHQPPHRQILRQWNLLRRQARRIVLPGAPGATIAADMLAGATKRQQHKTLWTRVEELAAAPGNHTSQMIVTDLSYASERVARTPKLG
jgi:hypothetical protein